MSMFEQPKVHPGETPEQLAGRLAGGLELNPKDDLVASEKNTQPAVAETESVDGDHHHQVVTKLLHEWVGNRTGADFAVRLYGVQHELRNLRPTPDLSYMREEVMKNITQMLDGYGDPSWLGRVNHIDPLMFGVSQEEFSALLAEKSEAYLNRNILRHDESGATPNELRERYGLKPLEYKEGIKALVEAVKSATDHFDDGSASYLSWIRKSFRTLRRAGVLGELSLQQYEEPELHTAVQEYLKKAYQVYLKRISSGGFPNDGEPQKISNSTGEKYSESEYIKEVMRSLAH